MRCLKWVLAPTCFLLLLSCSTSNPDPEIRAVLNTQMAAWNRGDIPAYMQGYENSAQTLFVGKDVRRGYETVLERYRERYPTSAQMGHLSFADIEVHPLDRDHAWVLGHWSLSRSPEAGGNVGGWYTLLFHRTPSGWKIILDHTS